MNSKYVLTDVSKELFGVKLFQIKALIAFGNVEAGELGGFIEKEDNLNTSGDAWVSGDARVYGNARVSGDARVSGNAWVSAKKEFIKGWFIGGDDSEKITKLSHEEIGNDYWKSNYVLGDYEIKDIEEEKKKVTMEELKKLVG